MSMEGGDWIDEALRAGQGFKSDEERSEYFKALGDPFEHPLFCNDPELLAKHPLSEGIRMIKEEDKSNTQLAIMYKEEGNEWLKKKTPKDIKAARDQYTYSLEFIDKAVCELSPESVASKKDELSQLRSVVLSNRAMAALLLQNYGSCIQDSTQAIEAWSLNIKAHFRKCKALFCLKKYWACLEACANCLAIDSANREVLVIKDQCRSELSKQRVLEIEKAKKTQAIRSELTATYFLAAENGVALKAPSSSLPPQLTQLTPHRFSGDDGVFWSLLLLYPQYGKIDVVHSALQIDMIAEYLAEALPEESSPPWDRDHEYHVSDVCVYIRTESEGKGDSLDEWLRVWESLAGGAAEEDDAAYLALYSQRPGNVCWLDAHLGVSVSTLLKTQGHIALGGVLHLIIFPRHNEAHSKFLRDVKDKGERVGHIDPSGVVTISSR